MERKSAKVDFLFVLTVNLVFDLCYTIMSVYIKTYLRGTPIEVKVPVGLC